MLPYSHLNHKFLNGVTIISSTCKGNRRINATIIFKMCSTSSIFSFLLCFIMQWHVHRTVPHQSINIWLYQCPFIALFRNHCSGTIILFSYSPSPDSARYLEVLFLFSRNFYLMCSPIGEKFRCIFNPLYMSETVLRIMLSTNG